MLGSRVVYEDYAVCSPRSDPSKAETEPTIDPSAMAGLSSEVLFDRLLFVLHGLLSNHQPNWLKPRPPSSESSKEFTLFDRDAAESLQVCQKNYKILDCKLRLLKFFVLCLSIMQNELSRMQLPDIIRWRIQAGMPILVPSLRCSLSCQPHSVPPTALSLVQPSGSAAGGPIQRNPPTIPKTGTVAAQGKLKQTMLSPPQQQESDNTDVVDPWTLLEDGTSSGLSSSNVSNSSDMANLRATCWLKGAVRVRRTDLTYVGSVDDDS